MNEDGSLTPDTAIAEPIGASAATWGPVDSLRLVGLGVVLPLNLSQSTITVGASTCDVVLPPTVPIAAAHQATIVRLAHTGAICVRERAGVDRLVRTGELFYLAGAPVLATDARLESIRKHLAWCIGLTNHAAVDAALEMAAEDRPIALLGPPGLDARRLAQTIHEASPHRSGDFLAITSAPLPKLVDVVGSTVFVDLEAVKVTAPFVRHLLGQGRGRGLRAIFAARSGRRLRFHLDTAADRVLAIPLTPLERRGDEILDLLAIHWREELQIWRDVRELGRGGMNLGKYRWPRNFDELREQSARLLAYVEHRGLRPAASALGIAHQTLSSHLRRIGFWADATLNDYGMR